MSIKEIDRKEWLKRLGVKGEADKKLNEQMMQAESLLFDAVNPRFIYRVLDRKEVPLEGDSIERHLECCHKVAIIAVTLGDEVDKLISKTQISDMSLALLLDTGASVLIEQVTDEKEKGILTDITKEGEFYATSRFSPGYGDYPLSYQKRILELLDASRKIGLSLTSGCMMVPHKSVSALIGLSDHPVKGSLATCKECVLREKCEFARI